METQAIHSLTQLLLYARLEGGHIGCNRTQETLWGVIWIVKWFGTEIEIQAICLFLIWAVESCVSEGDRVTPVLLNQVRMIQMNKNL